MKSARYHALRDRVLAVNDRVHAEPVLLKFNKGGASDPSRPAIEIEAVLRVSPGKETSVSGSSTSAAWQSRVSAERALLYIDRAQYPDLKFDIGDEVQAVSRVGEPWFEVIGVDDRGMARLVLQLGESI